MIDSIETTKLSVFLGRKQILHPTTLKIKHGECVGLIGKNGAGKTTLLRAIQGLINHKGFSNIAAMKPQERAKILAWVPQVRDIVWNINVKKLLQITANRSCKNKAEIEKTVSNALDLTKTAQLQQQSLYTLSSGEIALVSVARALCQRTNFLLLDEPIANLDPVQKQTIMFLFESLVSAGKGIVFTSHDMAAVQSICKRVIALNNGFCIYDLQMGDGFDKTIEKRIFN